MLKLAQKDMTRWHFYIVITRS